MNFSIPLQPSLVKMLNQYSKMNYRNEKLLTPAQQMSEVLRGFDASSLTGTEQLVRTFANMHNLLVAFPSAGIIDSTAQLSKAVLKMGAAIAVTQNPSVLPEVEKMFAYSEELTKRGVAQIHLSLPRKYESKSTVALDSISNDITQVETVSRHEQYQDANSSTVSPSLPISKNSGSQAKQWAKKQYKAQQTISKAESNNKAKHHKIYTLHELLALPPQQLIEIMLGIITILHFFGIDAEDVFTIC